MPRDVILAGEPPAYVPLYVTISGQRTFLGVAHVTPAEGGLIVHTASDPSGSTAAHIGNEFFPASTEHAGECWTLDGRPS